ncbi:hypothetical protein [Ferrimicrobium sp.]|uniref:hypothetical protein n=1 Tax=Ferrimicrobium sp. TaxID=2926050 RepID=UPI0026027318|nr:hypothetical protein [Ferrimicrobium sp.]
MSEFTDEEEVALVSAATLALLAVHRARASTPSRPPQDDTNWRFQNRWWNTGPLAARRRP